MCCDLQIFSGCVCHLEQLHAQSPFLFPIVFSINIKERLSAETNLPNIRMFVWPQVRSNSSFDLEYSKCQYGAFAGHNA